MTALWQTLLDGLGAVLAFLYDAVPNYGVAIILLTLVMRILLLPLNIKQFHSMQAMQALQPKMRELQRKYKGDRQALQEETMKLYRERGVNPLSGCFPVLAQAPVLIALFGVLQFPQGLTHIPHSDPNPVVGRPQDSRLYVDIVNQRTEFLGMNLLCNPMQAGRTVPLSEGQTRDAPGALDCGSGLPSRVPYYALALAFIGTTFVQQRQMQTASPASQQQQALTRILPFVFGVWGFLFPGGLVLYWTTSNGVQILLQHFMLSRKREMMQEQEAGKRDGARKGAPGKTAPVSRQAERKGARATAKPGTRGRGKQSATARGSSGTKGSSGSGGRDAGDRKKRRKR